MTDLKVAAGALHHDAQRWDRVSRKLGAAASSADDLYVDYLDWPKQGNRSFEVIQKYEKVRAKVTTLLLGGRTEAAEVADELRRVQKIIEGADESARSRIASQWKY